MNGQPSANPLIKTDGASTIDAICDYLGVLCDQKAQDSEAHPGELLQLEVVRQAALHLKGCVDLHG